MMIDLDAPIHRLVGQVLALQRVKPEQQVEPIPFPETFRDFLPYVYFPHIEDRDSDGIVPVCAWPLSPAQMRAIEQGSVIKLDSTEPSRGRDVWAKGRRMFCTALVYAWIIYSMLRYDGTRYTTFHQDQDKDTLTEALDQIRYVLERLPKEWVTEREPIVGSQVRLGRSRWGHRTSGHSEHVAAKQGIGGRREGVHYTELSKAAHAATLVAVTSKTAKGGWMIGESTPNPNGSWFNDECTRTESKKGVFRRYVFLGWWLAEHNRVRREGPDAEDYAAVMNAEFERTMPADEAAKERALVVEHGLDDEQVAFRRLHRCCGGSESRRKARAEYPESIEDAVGPTGESWLDASALDACYAMCADPIYRERLGTLHSVSCWMTPDDFTATGEMLVMFVDTAVKSGKDFSAIRVRTSTTCRVVAEVHGRALASELCDSVLWLLRRYVGSERNQTRYCVAVERNAGTGKDLIEHLINAGLRPHTRYGLYSEHVIDRRPGARPDAKRLRAGIYTGQQTRAMYMDRISTAVEGRGWEDGEQVPLGPTVEFRSRYTVDELAALRDIEGMVQAPVNGHDDLAIADGGCLLVCARVGGVVRSEFTAGGKRRSIPKARTASRRLGVPV